MQIKLLVVVFMALLLTTENLVLRDVKITFQQDFILGLQPRDKAAMLVINTKEIFLQNLHQNRVHFPAERTAFVLDHQHGRRDVTCKTSNKIDDNATVRFALIK